MHYIRIGMFSVKTPQGTPLRLLTSSIAIKQQWLTLDHWVFSLTAAQKTVVGLKKQRVKKNRMKLQKNFMVPFYGWGLTVSRLEPLWGGGLLYNTKFPEIPGTHFINLGRVKGWFDLGATEWFWPWESWIGNPAP